MDGGVECRSQTAAIASGGDGGGKGARFEVDPLAATGFVTRAAKGREKRSATIQGAGKEIFDVEAKKHARTSEGMEDGSSRSGKEAL